MDVAIAYPNVPQSDAGMIKYFVFGILPAMAAAVEGPPMLAFEDIHSSFNDHGECLPLRKILTRESINKVIK